MECAALIKIGRLAIELHPWQGQSRKVLALPATRQLEKRKSRQVTVVTKRSCRHDFAEVGQSFCLRCALFVVPEPAEFLCHLLYGLEPSSKKKDILCSF